MDLVFLRSQLDHLLSENLAAASCREQSTFSELLSSCNGSLVIYGAGNLGKKILAGLRQMGVEPLAFADGNPALWNTSIDGARVLSASRAATAFGQAAAFLVAVFSPGPQSSYVHIRDSLAKLGCRRIMPFMPLAWARPDLFLPHWRLDLPSKALGQAEAVHAAFALWEDDESRREYLAQLRLQLWADFSAIPPARGDDLYFPADLYALLSDEVFIDCGAFDGDTIRSLIDRQGDSFARIIAFEPDPINYEKLWQYAMALPEHMRARITSFRLAVGARRERVEFEETGSVSSRIDGMGTAEVDCVPLDEVLADCAPTLIKMDIEGAECAALAGAHNTIRRYSPLMAIELAHRQEDMWRVPLFLSALCDDYRFFLRRYSSGNEFWDIVCYAIPAARLCTSEK